MIKSDQIYKTVIHTKPKRVKQISQHPSVQIIIDFPGVQHADIFFISF